MTDLNNTYTLGEIIEFVKEQTGIDEVVAQTDIFNDLACTGDDFTNLIKKYKARFNVDMSTYLWYFHTNEEGLSVGSIFFKPPFERVERIPVTPEMLQVFANISKWDIYYPEHEIPSARFDIFINIILVFAAIFLILYVVMNK